MIILYSTHCPKCNVLKAKLMSSNIEFYEQDNMEIMLQKGFLTSPILEVDENVMDFATAIKWLSERKAVKDN